MIGGDQIIFGLTRYIYPGNLGPHLTVVLLIRVAWNNFTVDYDDDNDDRVAVLWLLLWWKA